MKHTEKILKALANRRRLAIIKFLNTKGNAKVGDIAKEIGISFKATSKHLGVLRTADIVDREQVSLEMYYSLSKPLSDIILSVIDVL